MKQVLIFAGTTEGRRLSEALSRASVPALVCVATEYGETLLPEGEGIVRRAGRLTEEEMETLMKSGDFSCVADATHPYAKAVSENIRKAAEEAGLPCFRLLREELHPALEEQAVFVDSVEEAARFLKDRPGNILVSTGSKELSCYTVIDQYKSRVFARVLSTESSVAEARRLGFEGRNLICMQGPFSEEMNYATMKEYRIDWLVTKESGRNGGYEEKLRAAERAGARVIVVGRPCREEGFSFEEVRDRIFGLYGIRPEPEKQTEVFLVSLGVGSVDLMTGEARHVIEDCDVLVGAGRMMEALESFHKPVYSSYKSGEIAEFLETHREYRKAAVVFSGDLGFYSGAKKLLPILRDKGFAPVCLPGVSSLVYLAARLQVPWDGARFMSIHGRRENIVQAVQEHQKVFVLLGGREGARELCRLLLHYGLSRVRVSVGEFLSYENERIRTGTPEELLKQECSELAAAYIENPEASSWVTVHGIPDEDFIRDKVPMTKFEVRSVSLSRLALTRNAVVYDIGAGTGSVAVEAARQAGDGQVYAVEKNPEAVRLLRENKRKFGAANMEIVEGLAPEALLPLPAPTHAFIGGSSGNLAEITALLLEKNPKVRIVINAIALETVAEAMALQERFSLEDLEVSQIMASRGKKVGRYEMMMGQNPVYVISFTGKGDDR